MEYFTYLVSYNFSFTYDLLHAICIDFSIKYAVYSKYIQIHPKIIKFMLSGRAVFFKDFYI